VRVIIAGSRTIKDFGVVFNAINQSSFQISELVCGMAIGVDLLGKQYADHGDIPVKEFEVSKKDWDRYGKAAGSIRNRRMAEYAEALILIWDGKSKGSANMKKCMEDLGKPIYEVIV